MSSVRFLIHSYVQLFYVKASHTLAAFGLFMYLMLICPIVPELRTKDFLKLCFPTLISDYALHLGYNKHAFSLAKV